MAVQDGGQHQGLIQQRVDPFLIGLDTNDTVLGERPRSISQKPDTLQDVLDNNRFEHIEFKLTIGAGDRDSGVVAHNLGSDHGHGLTLSGVDFSGHDTATGLVLRQAQLSQTTSRTRAEVTDIVGDLHQRDSDHIKSTMSFNQCVVRSKGLELEYIR